MKIARLDTYIVSVPYRHRENSARVRRDGVTAVLVRLASDDGLVGWGECCPGPNIQSIDAIVRAAAPMLLGRDPWNSEKLAQHFFHTAHWDLREMSGNFAYAGIDMALRDLQGKACSQPLYRLMGGRVRKEVDYFCYLAAGDPDSVAAQAAAARAQGYCVYYLKVGVDFPSELDQVAALREAIGSEGKIRIDANGAWSVAEAVRYLDAFDRYNIDFAEQPVSQDPVRNMAELRQKTRVPLAANEGLWRRADVWEVIRQRAADVLCFSPYWVGTLSEFQRFAYAAANEGLQICRHTHGELGLMAAASHQVCLTLPNLVLGNQQTAAIMEGDIITEKLPIAEGPRWGVPEGVGLSVDVDMAQIEKYAAFYREHGQFLPYQPEMFEE